LAWGLRVGMFRLAGLVYIDRELGIGFSKKERPWKTTKGQVIKEGRKVGQDSRPHPLSHGSCCLWGFWEGCSGVRRSF